MYNTFLQIISVQSQQEVREAMLPYQATVAMFEDNGTMQVSYVYASVPMIPNNCRDWETATMAKETRQTKQTGFRLRVGR